MLRAKERPQTPYSSDVFSLDSHLSLSRSLGVHQLKLFNFDKYFEIHFDAFDFVIGGILMQDEKLVAFENKKLNETERRWPTHEEELWTVIHYLKTWGHYIGSKDVVVWIDNVTLKYFATQPKLSSKQVRWQNTLVLFNVDIQHKLGKKNGARCAKSKTPT